MNVLTLTHAKPGEVTGQDVCAVSSRRVALADGMSGTRAPREWARSLCARAVHGPSLVDAVVQGTLDQWLQP
ncbi:MAG: hypothetical protein ACI9MC_001616, partial [Kiritimatiellia bacterium]